MLGVMSLMEIILSKPKKFQSIIFYYNFFSRVLFVIFSFVGTHQGNSLARPFLALTFFHVLCCYLEGFLFFFFTNDTHIFDLAQVISLAFDHFAFQLVFVGVVYLTLQMFHLSSVFIYFLGLSSLLNFVALLMKLGSLVSLLVLPPFFCRRL